MKKILNLCLPMLLLAAFSLPAFAQDEESAAPKEETAAPAKPAAKPAVKKKAPAKKKPAKKKKAAPPVSEYKFSSGESAPTYKFDKKGDPIVKAKKKKPAKKAAAKTGKAAPKAATKLKAAKPIGAEEQPAPGAEGQADQAAGE